VHDVKTVLENHFQRFQRQVFIFLVVSRLMVAITRVLVIFVLEACSDELNEILAIIIDLVGVSPMLEQFQGERGEVLIPPR
jgi:uncharacterized membrane protein